MVKTRRENLGYSENQSSVVWRQAFLSPLQLAE